MKAKQKLAAWSYTQAARPLQKQLVSLVVVVATLGIVLSFATVFFLMRGILMQRVDDQLQEGLDSWAGQGTWIPSIGVPLMRCRARVVVLPQSPSTARVPVGTTGRGAPE